MILATMVYFSEKAAPATGHIAVIVPPPRPLNIAQDFDSEDHDSRFHLLELFSESAAQYYVYVDATVHITPQTIPQLLTYNKPIIAPMCK